MRGLYEMLFRRKSVRRYTADVPLSGEELADLTAYLQELQPLLPKISVSFRIVKRTETNCLWGEYCLLAYSEEKAGYLENTGYLLEQVELYLVSRGIGTCWYGMGRPDARDWDGKRFVIMLAFGACKETMFRQKGEMPRRRDVWSGLEGGHALQHAVQTACRAPSACNSQPWRLELFQSLLRVSRAAGLRTPVTASLTAYMNLIDMGIFLYAMELSLAHEGIGFERVLTFGRVEKSLVSVAEYQLSGLQ